MSTTWPPALDMLQGAAQRLAKVAEEMSGGRFRIEVFPGGQIMPQFDCFDAASKGTIEAFMGAPYYWPEKEPAVQWFSTVPFGMDPAGMTAWYYQGDGLRLWEEAGDGGRQGRNREDPHGQKGARVLHEVPDHAGPLGSRRLGCLPSVRRGVRRTA